MGHTTLPCGHGLYAGPHAGGFWGVPLEINDIHRNVIVLRLKVCEMIVTYQPTKVFLLN